MKYKSVVVSARGGPEVIEIVEKELLPPGAGEARVKILATPVTQDDVAVRVGNRPWLADLPFVPGYSILGVVEAVGEGVTSVQPGDQVIVDGIQKVRVGEPVAPRQDTGQQAPAPGG